MQAVVVKVTKHYYYGGGEGVATVVVAEAATPTITIPKAAMALSYCAIGSG